MASPSIKPDPECSVSDAKKPKTEDADMSVDSLFTDSRLAYSASHGSKEWTTTTTRCYWHYVSNNMDYSGC